MDTPSSIETSPPTLVNVQGTISRFDSKSESRNDAFVDMAKLSMWMKYGLLGIFTLAQFQEAGSISMVCLRHKCI
jgi:hypothetical protein